MVGGAPGQWAGLEGFCRLIRANTWGASLHHGPWGSLQAPQPAWQAVTGQRHSTGEESLVPVGDASVLLPDVYLAKVTTLKTQYPHPQNDPDILELFED